MIDLIRANWIEVLFVIVCVLAVVYGCATDNCIEWLKIAVAKAEKELGSGTGQLKLRYTYDMFIDKFPGMSSVIPFWLFSYYVKIALKWFERQLESNLNVKYYIKGDNL